MNAAPLVTGARAHPDPLKPPPPPPAGEVAESSRPEGVFAPPTRIALLGCGTVGREVAARLLDSRLNIELVKVLVRDTSKDRGLPPHLFTSSLADIEHAGPDLVIELIGGLEPAASMVASFLRRGIPVVTANKTLIAHRGRELSALAGAHREAGAALAFEASVCAAIPIIATLRHLAGDRIKSIRGVVNGSCNFILSRLAEGWRFDDALAEARKRGLVEPNPSADISGRDSAEKLCVLAAAVGAPLSPDHVETRGIESLTPDDLAAARRSGRTIKLLAELTFDGPDGAPRARVGPTLIPRAHPLAQVDDEENAISIDSELGGDLFLRGRGAGPRPTASAILGDVARLAGRAAPAPVLAPRAEPAHKPSLALGSSLPWPPQRHHIRISAESLAPEPILTAARTINAAELSLSRTTARIEAAPCSLRQATACAQALGPHSLVIPILE